MTTAPGENIGTGKSKVCVKFENADISWGYKVKTDSAEGKAKSNKYAGPQIEKVEHPLVANVNLDMKRGDFLTIIGTVGCGKSTMLMSVMQETEIMKGSSEIKGSIAYVEQEPFIFSASIQENIMFG